MKERWEGKEREEEIPYFWYNDNLNFIFLEIPSLSLGQEFLINLEIFNFEETRLNLKFLARIILKVLKEDLTRP